MNLRNFQNGKNRANYGEQVINNVSKALTDEFGRGFSARTIRQCRQFYQMFPKFSIKRSMIAISANSPKIKRKTAIADRTIEAGKSKSNLAITDRQIQTLESQPILNWTHIQRIMRVSDPQARALYSKGNHQPKQFMRFS